MDWHGINKFSGGLFGWLRRTQEPYQGRDASAVEGLMKGNAGPWWDHKTESGPMFDEQPGAIDLSALRATGWRGY